MARHDLRAGLQVLLVLQPDADADQPQPHDLRLGQLEDMLERPTQGLDRKLLGHLLHRPEVSLMLRRRAGVLRHAPAAPRGVPVGSFEQPLVRRHADRAGDELAQADHLHPVVAELLHGVVHPRRRRVAAGRIRHAAA